MKLKFRWSWSYFLLTVLVLFIEVLIATFGSEFFILRAYIGDVIAIWFLYFLILSFLDFTIKEKYSLVLFVLGFAVLLEVSQYFHLVEFLGFSPQSLIGIVLGNSFAWLDMVCYVVGATVLWTVIFFKKEEISWN